MTAATAGTSRLGRSRRWRYWSVPLVALSVLALFWIRPLRVQYHIQQGRKSLAKFDFPKAMDDFQAAHQVDPTHAETAFWIARSCRKTGDLAGVRKYLEEAAQHGYSDRKRLEREWWLALADSGRIKEAEPHLPDMLIDPGEDGPEICDAFSKSFCVAMRFSDARRLLDVWAAEFPKDYRPFLRRAQILAGDERWAEAITNLREALKRSPNDSTIQRELGRSLFKNRESAGAEHELQAVLRRDHNDVTALMILAECFFDQDDYAKSLEYLKRIHALQPQFFPAPLLMAKVHLGLSDATSSIAIAESLVADWPEDLESQFILARALRAAKRHEEAQRHFLLHEELQKNVAIIEALSRDLKKSPSDAQIRYDLGKLLLKHVSRPEGVAYLESVFQFEPAHQGAHQLLADYYEKLGNPTLSTMHRQFATKNDAQASTLTP